MSLPRSMGDFFNWHQQIAQFTFHQDKTRVNLEAALNYMGVNRFGINSVRHRALADSALTARLFEKLKTELK